MAACGYYFTCRVTDPAHDSEIQGSITDVLHDTAVGELTRGIHEGVAFASCDCFDARTATDAKMEPLVTTDGGTRSRYWLHLIPTVLNVPLQLRESGEFGTAIGAARLGMSTSNLASMDRVLLVTKHLRSDRSNQSLSDTFAEAHRDFAAAYPVIKRVKQMATEDGHGSSCLVNKEVLF